VLTNGTLQRDQVKLRLPEFIAAQNSMFPIKYAKFGNSPLFGFSLWTSFCSTLGVRP
jgi:hypothetical protein